jgi:hypothetical protein
MSNVSTPVNPIARARDYKVRAWKLVLWGECDIETYKKYCADVDQITEKRLRDSRCVVKGCPWRGQSCPNHGRRYPKAVRLGGDEHVT